MQVSLINRALLTLPPVRDRALAIANGRCYFGSIFNGSDSLVVTGRDKNATWRSLSTLCRERDWSKPRALYELQNGLRYRTVPPGHVVDWRDPTVERSLDVEASTVTLVLGVFGDGGLGVDVRTVGIEVAERPTIATASASVRWAIDATRKLRAENKIPEGARKADLARLLEAEAQKAVKANQLSRALKASYLEDQLAAWGIWPLGSFE
jgi:hypothetical protein